MIPLLPVVVTKISTFETVKSVAALHYIKELNIGHFIIGEAIFNGLDNSIMRMKLLMKEARERKVGQATSRSLSQKPFGWSMPGA